MAATRKHSPQQSGPAPSEHSLYANVLVELIEAAVRSDQPQSAAEGLDRLAERTQASGSDWALGLEARSRALVTPGPAAEPLYQAALQRLARAPVPPYLARAQLVYGEWLRRQNRRLDARRQLRAAHDTFSRIGAEAFAARARRELTATGETVRKLTVETRDVLTPQEAQVARLAQEGQTNPEIGAELFISPRTVEYHLHKVFTKLDIRSRKELRAALADADGGTGLARRHAAVCARGLGAGSDTGGSYLLAHGPMRHSTTCSRLPRSERGRA